MNGDDMENFIIQLITSMDQIGKILTISYLQIPENLSG